VGNREIESVRKEIESERARRDILRKNIIS